MDGGSGNDRFVFAAGFGSDRILGFDADPSGGQDLLDISAMGITAANFSAHVTFVDLGADFQITIDGSNVITLVGVSGSGTTTITQQDFILL
jgi:Ca2+-binding RTX toxin-like protein